MKADGVYHTFIKNETTRYVEHATATSVTGPWTFVGTGNFAGWGSGMEGPTVVRLDDGTWKIFLDGQGSVGFLQASSPDLTTWSATSPLPVLSDLVRHGTIIRDTPAVGGDGGDASDGGSDANSGTGGEPSGGHSGATSGSDSSSGCACRLPAPPDRSHGREGQAAVALLALVGIVAAWRRPRRRG